MEFAKALQFTLKHTFILYDGLRLLSNSSTLSLTLPLSGDSGKSWLVGLLLGAPLMGRSVGLKAAFRCGESGSSALPPMGLYTGLDSLSVIDAIVSRFGSWAKSVSSSDVGCVTRRGAL